MRTVKGPTDHVVVVGAGLAGLSAAMRLAGAGRTVTVVERESIPGGRAGRLDIEVPDGTYRFDTGPTVLTMPDLIADAFDCLGEEMSDWLTLEPVAPLYRSFYPDGSVLDVHSDVDQMADEIDRVISPEEAAGYRRVRRLRLEALPVRDEGLHRPQHRLAARPGDPRPRAAGRPRRLPQARRRRSASTSRTRAPSGSTPSRRCTPASPPTTRSRSTPSSPTWTRSPACSSPRAACTPCPRRWPPPPRSTESSSATTPRSRRSRRSATAPSPCTPRTASGFPADVVVLNPDLPVAYRDLLGREPWSVRRLTYSPSCFLLLAGSTAQYSKIAHHNIHFGRSWQGVFDELIDKQRLMSDPSILVTNPSHSDPSLAPDGKQIYYVLFPTPNLDAPIDWRTEGPRYRDEVVRTLEQRGLRRASATPSRSRTSRPPWTGRLAAWSAAPRSPRRTRSSRPGRSAPATCGARTSCSPGRGRSRASACRWCSCPGGWPPSAITGPDPSYRSRARRW